MILETIGVSKQFGRIQALQDVDLNLEEGEVYGIAGPNGAGKSTLFNVIAGTYLPSAGEIFFNGHNITSFRAHKICQLGVARTFQTPQTFKSLSVYDNVRVGATFGKKYHGRKRIEQKVDEVIHFLDLTAVADTPASNLDLYTRKLVMVAASLSTGCKLLMLDEPLAGLSVTEIRSFLNTVKKINKEQNITIIIIEHLLDSLIDISNRMLILNDGKTIYSGDPEGVRLDRKVIEVYLGAKEDE